MRYFEKLRWSLAQIADAKRTLERIFRNGYKPETANFVRTERGDREHDEALSILDLMWREMNDESYIIVIFSCHSTYCQTCFVPRIRNTIGNDNICELQQYLDQPIEKPIVASSFDLIKWWKVYTSFNMSPCTDTPHVLYQLKSTEFPNLSRMALDLLTIPATCVPIERSFSSTGNVVTPKRASMTSETLKYCQELKGFLKFGQQKLFDCLMNSDIDDEMD